MLGVELGNPKYFLLRIKSEIKSRARQFGGPGFGGPGGPGSGGPGQGQGSQDKGIGLLYQTYMFLKKLIIVKKVFTFNIYFNIMQI